MIGASKDSVDSHAKFRAKYDLGVTPVSDHQGKLCQDYGVWVEKSNYGRTYMGIERSTFLIDGTGMVRHLPEYGAALRWRAMSRRFSRRRGRYRLNPSPGGALLPGSGRALTGALGRQSGAEPHHRWRLPGAEQGRLCTSIRRAIVLVHTSSKRR